MTVTDWILILGVVPGLVTLCITGSKILLELSRMGYVVRQLYDLEKNR